MTGELAGIEKDDTRERLLAAAHQQFAERGFHGASIALIAGEIGLTKQALLYHFKRKEEIYGEVLRRIAERMMTAARKADATSNTPEENFEQTILNIFNSSLDNPLDTMVLMREMLDNQRQDVPEDQWFLKALLDEVVAKLEKVEGQADLPFADKVARVYLLLSAIQFYAGSGPVLTRFYGDKESEQIGHYFPQELGQLVRRLLKAGEA